MSGVTYPATGLGQLTTIGRDTLQRINNLTYTLGNGTAAISDAVTRATSGDILSGTENGVAKSYTYDTSGRLTGATIGASTYGYSFAAPSGTTCNQTGANLNAHKNGNRTSSTINGVTNTYCYDQADRLIASSDTKVTAAQYDPHGNTTQLGTSPVTQFGYDISDRNNRIFEPASGKTVTYTRDSQNRVVQRHTDTNGSGGVDNYYGFTGSGDTPDFVKNSGGTVTEKYFQLPGGALLTVRPQAVGAAQFTYSLANIHGDVFATLNGIGSLIATHLTGPFGEVVSGQATPGNSLGGATYNWVGTNEKLTESDLALQPTQMGARVYLASIGRFLQVDPQEGGTDNAYAYANDPVNDFDLDGNAVNWDLRKIGKWAVIGAGVAGAIACGISVVCGVAVGAAAGAASYAVAKGGTKEFTYRGLAGSALVGGLTAGIGAKFNVGGAIVNKLRGPASRAVSRLANGNNLLRIGWARAGAPFRVSLGPAPSHYAGLSRIGKALSPLHLHMERAKGGLDLNWFRASSGNGVKSIRLWGSWRPRW